jgi:hypothetical protein
VRPQLSPDPTTTTTTTTSTTQTLHAYCDWQIPLPNTYGMTGGEIPGCRVHCEGYSSGTKFCTDRSREAQAFLSTEELITKAILAANTTTDTDGDVVGTTGDQGTTPLTGCASVLEFVFGGAAGDWGTTPLTGCASVF